MNIIAIAGKAGSGKDTIADYICSKYANTYKEAFADPLKRACAQAFGVPIAHFYDREIKEIDHSHWNISPRVMAQRVGTEMFREIQDDMFWARRMGFLIDGRIQTDTGAIYDSEDNIVIPDLRFKNEYEWAMSRNALIIHLTRPTIPGTVGIPNHSSEAGITLDPDYSRNFSLVNNDTKERLYEKVDEIMQAAFTFTFTNHTTYRFI